MSHRRRPNGRPDLNRRPATVRNGGRQNQWRRPPPRPERAPTGSTRRTAGPGPSRGTVDGTTAASGAGRSRAATAPARPLAPHLVTHGACRVGRLRQRDRGAGPLPQRSTRGAKALMILRRTFPMAGIGSAPCHAARAVTFSPPPRPPASRVCRSGRAGEQGGTSSAAFTPATMSELKAETQAAKVDAAGLYRYAPTATPIQTTSAAAP